MKITCAVEKGGCGEKFEPTSELIADYKRCIENGENSGCPNPSCSRSISPEELSMLVRAVERSDKPRSYEKWPGFPLTSPVVPSGRRKNGAAPGISFREIVKEELDRDPTPDEIRRLQRFFAGGLDDGIDCPCCTRHAQRQHRAFSCGPARWLIELVYLSDGERAVHTGEVIKALKGNNVSGSDATSILPLYGLIIAVDDPSAAVNPPPPSSRSHAKGRTSGFWRPTKLGRAFALDKIKIPERIVTCLGIPEAFEGNPVSIREVLGKKFNYDAIIERKAKL